MRKKLAKNPAVLAKTIPAVFAAAGLAILFAGPAQADSGSQPASGTLHVTSHTVDSSHVVAGTIFLVVTVNGTMTGTFDGSFTETDNVVIHPDGSVTVEATGVESGTLGTCGTGSVDYIVEAQGTTSTFSGNIQFIGQSIFSVDTFTQNGSDGTYTGTYQCI